MALRHREVCDLILYELYWITAEPQLDGDIAPYDLQSLVDWQTSTAFFEAALEKLANDYLIERVGILPDTVAITKNAS